MNRTFKELTSLAEQPDDLRDWIETALSDGDPRLPDAARWAASREDVDLLIWLMDDFIVNCEMDTVEAIRESMDLVVDLMTKRLTQMLTEGTPETRRAGALMAGLLEVKALAPQLITALNEDAYFLTRMEAAVALGKLRHLPAIPALRDALADEDILTRGAAIEALMLLPDPDLSTAITGRFVEDPPEYQHGALDDPETRGRAHVIRLLKKHQPLCAREVLLSFISEAEESFRDLNREGVPIGPADVEVLDLARAVLTELST